MLQRLHELNPQLIRRISRRIFFVVNKMDVVSIGAQAWRCRRERVWTASQGTEGAEHCRSPCACSS